MSGFSFILSRRQVLGLTAATVSTYLLSGCGSTSPADFVLGTWDLKIIGPDSRDALHQGVLTVTKGQWRFESSEHLTPQQIRNGYRHSGPIRPAKGQWAIDGRRLTGTFSDPDSQMSIGATSATPFALDSLPASTDAATTRTRYTYGRHDQPRPDNTSVQIQGGAVTVTYTTFNGFAFRGVAVKKS